MFVCFDIRSFKYIEKSGVKHVFNQSIGKEFIHKQVHTHTQFCFFAYLKPGYNNTENPPKNPFYRKIMQARFIENK